MRGKEPGSNLVLCAFSLIREHRFRCVIISRNTKSQLRRKWGDRRFRTVNCSMRLSEFDLLVTTDHALRTQQNLSKRKIAILVLPFASWPRLEPHAETIAPQVATVRLGEYVEIDLE